MASIRYLAVTAALALAAPAAAQPVQHDHRAPAAEAAPMPGVPASLADWAKGARIFPGLGNFHRQVTTRSPEAQAYFDQGMRFIWAFNHDEATRSFAKAAEIDPTCAACYWGVALTLGPNYNMPMMAEARAQVGWEAYEKGRIAAAKASPVEQALIEAVGKRYSGPRPIDPSNSRPVLAAYVAAMRQIADRFPADMDVQTLYAEALMNTNPWKLWKPDGTPGPGTPDILAALQRVLAKDPTHPGANHYWIHAVEASPHPERALHSAELLTGMMPAAGHLEHMPAHILQRVGRYEEAAEANRKGAAADLAYLGETAPPDYYPMYLIHNFQFLAYSAAMEGRREESVEATRKVMAAAPEAMLLTMPGLDWSVGYVYDSMIRFGLWADLLKEKAPNPKLAGLTIAWLQGQANALAATGKPSEAKAMAAQAGQLIATTAPDARQGMNSARSLYEIGQLRAEARIALAERRTADAIAALRDAAAREDGIAYDEPSDFFFPIRHQLGAVLLSAGHAAEAEAVYRDDLARHPHNGWALFGLAKALAAEKKSRAAATARTQFAGAWKHADVQLTSSAY